MQLYQIFLTISLPHTMLTVLTKNFFYDFTSVSCLITIHLLADLHRVNTNFLYLSRKWLNLVETLISFFLHVFLHIFLYIFLQIFTSLFCCWHLRLQYWSFGSFLLILPSFYTFKMDFLTLNFGQLLHLLDNELKNIIRNIKNQKKEFISAQYGILFNQTCLNEELYSAHIYIYTLYVWVYII